MKAEAAIKIYEKATGGAPLLLLLLLLPLQH